MRAASPSCIHAVRALSTRNAMITAAMPAITVLSSRLADRRFSTTRFPFDTVAHHAASSRVVPLVSPRFADVVPAARRRGSCPARLGRADLAQERVDLAAQPLGLAAERLGGRLDALRRGAGRIRTGGHAGDAVRQLLGAPGRLLGVARDLLGRRALLLDG